MSKEKTDRQSAAQSRFCATRAGQGGRTALLAFLLVAVLAQFLLALVRCYFFTLSLSSTGHKALLSIDFNGVSWLLVLKTDTIPACLQVGQRL